MPLFTPLTSQIRAHLVKMSHEAKAPHLGSALSCVDIIVSLYSGILNIDPGKPQHPERDRFILSKGHAATALYAILAEKGFFGKELLATYAQPGSSLPEHPSMQCVPGVEAATGSLGHGLSLGLGLAKAAKLLNQGYKTYILLSDGECNEGSIWEAALLAPQLGLDNLCAIIDFNKWQATGRSQEVTALEPLDEKFAAFGWEVMRIDGHNFEQLNEAFNESFSKSNKPFAVIADTVKGKGISFMEDDNNWHYRIPQLEEVKAACLELEIV